MTKLTELEKQKAITCVGYIEGKFRCDRYKLEMEYDKLGHYDEELDKNVTRYDINASKIIKPESAQIKWSDIKPKESTPESKNDNWFTKMFN